MQWSERYYDVVRESARIGGVVGSEMIRDIIRDLRSGGEDVLRELVKRVMVPACYENNVKQLEMVLAEGCDCNMIYDLRSGRSLLMWASTCNVIAVKVLLAAGANVLQVDSSKRDALMHAVETDNTECRPEETEQIVDTLLSAGANTQLRDCAGQSAYDIATRQQQEYALPDSVIKKLMPDTPST